MSQYNMHRRQFIRGTSAALALAALRANGMDLFNHCPHAESRIDWYRMVWEKRFISPDPGGACRCSSALRCGQTSIRYSRPIW